MWFNRVQYRQTGRHVIGGEWLLLICNFGDGDESTAASLLPTHAEDRCSGYDPSLSSILISSSKFSTGFCPQMSVCLLLLWCQSSILDVPSWCSSSLGRLGTILWLFGPFFIKGSNPLPFSSILFSPDNGLVFSLIYTLLMSDFLAYPHNSV